MYTVAISRTLGWIRMYFQYFYRKRSKNFHSVHRVSLQPRLIFVSRCHEHVVGFCTGLHRFYIPVGLQVPVNLAIHYCHEIRYERLRRYEKIYSKSFRREFKLISVRPTNGTIVKLSDSRSLIPRVYPNYLFRIIFSNFVVIGSRAWYFLMTILNHNAWLFEMFFSIYFWAKAVLAFFVL